MPSPFPNIPVLLYHRPERIDLSAPPLTCPGTSLRLVMQITETDKRSYVTHSEQRNFVYIINKEGQGTYLYQSFAGTGGKMQGWWFPSGGVLAGPTGDHAWVIKGSPKRDPAEGREALLRLLEEANEFLPHSDPETDEWIEQVTGMDYVSFHHTNETRIKPVVQVTVSLRDPEVLNHWMVWAYHLWKTHGTTKQFGPRTFNFPE